MRTGSEPVARVTLRTSHREQKPRSRRFLLGAARAFKLETISHGGFVYLEKPKQHARKPLKYRESERGEGGVARAR